MLTKLDGTAKGGIVLAIHEELGLPDAASSGWARDPDDLVAFDPDEFAAALVWSVRSGDRGPAAVRLRRRSRG